MPGTGRFTLPAGFPANMGPDRFFPFMFREPGIMPGGFPCAGLPENSLKQLFPA